MAAEQVKAIWKNILSRAKTTWGIDDYPLRYKKQGVPPGEYRSGEVKTWLVQIINWWTMSGMGDTQEKAYLSLKENFENYKEHDNLPRPGTKPPLQYADASRIDDLDELAADFFERIMGRNYHDCFISDLSSVFDFFIDETEALQKINETYHLELTELGDGNIVRLLTLIAERYAR